MDFADDFTYFSFEQVLQEVKRLYAHNKHIRDIRLSQVANDGPVLNFYVEKPEGLSIKQLGLPGRFRCLETRFIAANDAAV